MDKNKMILIANRIILLNKKEIREIFGYCERSVDKMFADSEFPAISFGKKHLVELDALKKYLSTRRG